ncbi:MAG: SRPBCC domain-containing protein, partial [Actinomycetota bacterium]|nr:SRPBCC domain-containing protein [Actinomycetota bacterium]
MREAPDETSVVEHEVRIAARPETVFPYFTDPVRMVRWMGIDATLDPRPGGVCRITVNDAGVVIGRYVQVDPPSRVTFTWGWEERLWDTPPQSTEIEVSLIPDGDGTLVRLAHRRLRGRAAAPHRRGWE